MSTTGMAESASPTLTPTEEEGDNQGTHELELHYGGELDLHQHVVCDKNPGHVDFIPVRFLLLYSTYENEELNFFSTRAADLTTKLKVRYVSPGRSKLKDYPLSTYAGKKKLGVGSGCVTGIDDQGSFPCPLENCPHSTEPHQVYGYIIITTAAHVVFDDDEAKETIVEFFDDDPKDKKNVEIAHGVKVRHCSVEGDFCEFMCVTHSQSLLCKISRLFSMPFPLYVTCKEWEKTLIVRILRLFELIKMFKTQPKGNSNLQAILNSDQNTNTRYVTRSTKHVIHRLMSFLYGAKYHHHVESKLLMVEDFLNVAESVSGIAGLRASVQCFLYDRNGKPKPQQDFSYDVFAKDLDLETTIKRIALIGAMHVFLSSNGYSDSEHFLASENIYLFFRDILNRIGVSDSEPKTGSALSSFDLLDEKDFEMMLGEDKTSTFENYSISMKRWFSFTHDQNLLALNDKLDNMLKCQLITKLSSQVRGSGFQTIKNLLLRMSDSIDQVSSTLSLYFRFGDDYNEITERIFCGPDHDKQRKCRHLTQLWRENTVIPKDDDLLTAMLEDLYQKSSDLIMKVAKIKETASTSYNFIPAFSAENIRKCLVDTNEMFLSVYQYGDQSEKAFIQEVKRIIDVPCDVFQQHTNKSLLIHISHPHGQSKQVTIGEHFSCNTGTGYYEHIYTVPTCNGCSGGPVWILPKTENGEILWDKIHAVPHGGCYDRGNKLNHSSSWTFSPFSVRYLSEGQFWDANERDSIVPHPVYFKSLSRREVGYSAAKILELEKDWLWYLLESTDIRLLSGMTVKDAIKRKKTLEAGQRISEDDDVECLLSLACQYEWP